jgi:hypothetical protein
VASESRGPRRLKSSELFRFSVLRLVLVILVVFIAWLAIAIWLAVYRDRRSLSTLGAADYPQVRDAMHSLMAHMPATLPAGATSVRIYAPGALGTLMPIPDQRVEVRMVLTPAAAAAIAASATTRGHTYPTNDPKWDGVPEGLRTADDQDFDTPMPSGFVSFTNGRLHDRFVGGITVNPTTGEVIYWAVDR